MSKSEIARRREAALKKMLKTRSKPHVDMKVKKKPNPAKPKEKSK